MPFVLQCALLYPPFNAIHWHLPVQAWGILPRFLGDSCVSERPARGLGARGLYARAVDSRSSTALTRCAGCALGMPFTPAHRSACDD